MIEISALDVSLAALRVMVWGNAVVAVALLGGVTLWIGYSMHESERR
jgi:hypothetical protein